MSQNFDVSNVRSSIIERLRKSFGRGGEVYCRNDNTEIIYGGLRPEHAPPKPYTSARVTLGSMTYRDPSTNRWVEGGYCPNCDFTTQRPVTGEKLEEIEREMNTHRY